MDMIENYLISQAEVWLPRLGMTILLIVVFWVLIKLSNNAVGRLAVRVGLDPYLSRFLARSLRVTLMVIAAITILGTLGVNVSALVASLGLTGFALGFAFKDTIANLLAGILILLYRPFNIGEVISIAGYEGVVSSIDLRYTILYEGQTRVLVPNSKLFTDPIAVNMNPEIQDNSQEDISEAEKENS